jgi:hypothetical protein
MKTRVCTNCGYVGKPISQGVSSFLVDIFMWMLVGGASAVTGLLPLLLIPLAWTIYHIALYRITKCPKCECLDMVGMESSKGKSALTRARHA